MSRRDLWREGEVRVISVTPVSKGVVRPLLLTVTTLALIVEGAARYSWVHRYEQWFVIVMVLPFAAVTLTRTWRWRSHKVHVTSERVVIEGGVLRHQRTAIELRDVLASRVDQRVSERLVKRGFVYLETAGATFPVGLVRHPGALCRLIDAERITNEDSAYPLDTVFTYDDPDRYQLEVRPDEWQRRRYE
ncbi:MAG: PH domain-containing protein [Acidimicrobiales bacterium]